MNRRTTTLALAVAALCAAAAPCHAMKCTVCHSKRPEMVRMHRALQDRETGCFDCHKVGEKLMGKGRARDRQAQLARRVADPLCTGCHRK